jgi:hypothetical protein
LCGRGQQELALEVKVAPFEPSPALLAKIRQVWKSLPRTDARMKQLALKNVNNGLNTNTSKNVNNCLYANVYSYLETLGGQSTNLYLNVIHFFNTSVN